MEKKVIEIVRNEGLSHPPRKEPQTTEILVKGKWNIEWTWEETHFQLLFNCYHYQSTKFWYRL